MNDEQTIRGSMAKWRSALEQKDVAAMMEDYLPNALLYDVKPPYKIVGAECIRAMWEVCLPYFPDEFKSEHCDLQVHVDGDVAFVHGVHGFIPKPADHRSGQTWIRLTMGWRRVEGHWKVAHEHASVPYDPMTNQVWPITDPDKLDTPDYCQEN